MNGDQKEQVLIVAAHPDDEVLGCGGTMARHAERGDDVHVVFLAEGGAVARLGLTEGARRDEVLGGIRMAARKAATVLDVRPPVFLEFPDNRMDGVQLLDVAKALEAIVAQVRPSLVYTHHVDDLNVDHQVAHQAVLVACRPQPGNSVRVIRAFEVLSSTEWASPHGARQFVPTSFVDISRFSEKKMAALRCYRDEMRPFPHARSIEAVEALARLRGASVGLAAAEAFALIREIVVS